MRIRIYSSQNFESLRLDGYFYIDKTALIYQMVKTGRYYFLSRPRRFGKSLLISTLEAYFQGKKGLFAGLTMENLEKDWINTLYCIWILISRNTMCQRVWAIY